MTSDLIETMARAICKSRSCEGVMCCEWPAQRGRPQPCPVALGGYDEAARDAFAAIAAAGYRVVRERTLDSQYWAGAKAGWNASQADDPKAAFAAIERAYTDLSAHDEARDDG